MMNLFKGSADVLAAFEKEQDSLNYLNNKHPNKNLAREKEVNHSVVFFVVFIPGINHQNLTLQTYHKSTYRVRGDFS